MSESKSIERTRELTEAELNHVSGGRGEAPVIKLREVVIAGAAEANKEQIAT